MELSNAVRARARGCLLGQLTGDALGTTVEFMSAARIAALYPDGLREVVGGGPFRVAAGQVTDDSELALALARTLAAEGADLDAIARAYVAWCGSDPIDIGGTTLNAFSGYGGRSVDAATVTARAVEYNGHPKKQANGSLMRVSPLGIYGAALPAERLAALARRDSRLSHPTPACEEACVAYTRGVAVAVAEGAGAERVFEAALAAVDSPTGRESGVHGWLLEARTGAPVCDAGGIGWVAIALKNAFHQLLHAESFEAGLVATVMAGGDTDTNGAIAGALLGAVHGELDIPARWRDAVLGCRPQRDVFYHAHDARELALRVLERGVADAGEA